MKTAILTCLAWTGLCAVLAAGDAGPGTAEEILALERGAMQGWLVGDPGPALALLAPEITYFHYPLSQRLQGRSAVAALFEPYRGRPLFDSYEMLDPEVQLSGDAAILTYQLVSHRGTTSERWNSTQVFEKKEGGWQIVHAHWSKVESPRPSPQP
jgi:ketosteroid isomerase-like protein